jgi:DNA-binding IclR family transcriptional regulator
MLGILKQGIFCASKATYVDKNKTSYYFSEKPLIPAFRKADSQELDLPSRNKESYSIQAVENALDVLEALSEGADEVRISQLSEKLSMNKTSVFRLLATFENRGYVEKEPETGKYRLGLSAYEIAQKFLSKMGLLRHARPVMEHLARECNEAVYLAMRSKQDVLFLDMVDVTQQVKIISLAGRRYPLDKTAAGQVILSCNSYSQVAAEVSDLPLPAEQAMTIQKQGYCYDVDALGEGIASIAAPLLGEGGKLHGVLCLVGPTYRLPDQALEEKFLPPLREACRVVSSKLGWHSYYLPPKSI